MHRELIKKKITPVIENRLREMKKSGDNYVSPVIFVLNIFKVGEIIINAFLFFK
jgi:hypothetical protein